MSATPTQEGSDMPRRPLIVSLVAGLAFSTACSGAPEESPTAAPSSSTPAASALAVPSASAVPSTSTVGASAAPSASSSGTAPAEAHNDADVLFAQMMIPHHEQALMMVDILLAKDGVAPGVKQLAGAIRAAQEPEIQQMRGWLEAWGAPEQPATDHGGGMMSGEELTALDEADGAAASRLFLEQMIAHHESAVEMARAALSGGRAPEVLALAQQVLDTQTAEIQRMQELLAES